MRPVGLEARVGHLDEKPWPGGMGMPVVAEAAPRHHHVRLGLRLVVERDRGLAAHFPAGREDPARQLLGHADGGHVRGALRLAHHHIAAQQLNVLPGTERAEIHEALVLDASPALRAQIRSGHGLR